MKPTVYVPAVAKFAGDLNTSYGFLKDFQDRGFDTGLMLVVLGGRASLEGELRDKQYGNFKDLTTRVGDLPVIIMASNRPLEDLDFYHHPEKSAEHIKAAVDFARGLPGALDHVVTFHLNSLLKPEEWAAAGVDVKERYSYFGKKFEEDVLPALRAVADYAASKGVKLQIETCPVPEFGDCDDGDIEDGIPVNQLGNPFPLFSGRGADQIREAGLGVALDLCHTYTLYRAAKEKAGTDGFFDAYRGLFPRDVELLLSGSLGKEVSSLKAGEIVHLNDSRGLFVPGESVHEEGIALGEGDISSLEEIVPELFRSDLRVVFEVHETDFDNRPNLRTSMDYVLRRI
jgi:sugar phosphate isomerase/epimerase